MPVHVRSWLITFLTKNKRNCFKCTVGFTVLALQFSCDKVSPKLPFLPIQPLSCFIRSVAYQSFAKFISSTQRIMYFLLKHIFCAGVRYKCKQTDLVLWSSLFLMEWYLANSVKQLWQKLFRFWDSSGSGVNLSKMKKKKNLWLLTNDWLCWQHNIFKRIWLSNTLKQNIWNLSP